jgi:hypothetical protein
LKNNSLSADTGNLLVTAADMERGPLSKIILKFTEQLSPGLWCNALKSPENQMSGFYSILQLHAVL